LCAFRVELSAKSPKIFWESFLQGLEPICFVQIGGTASQLAEK